MNLNMKYRPTAFEDVCGQTVTVKILQKVVANRNFKNAYMFSGITGCGKTTVARIFANLINNGLGHPIEIDAASNGSVDSIRAIVESANQRDLEAEYKIFIIDECHSISNTGWQAFLKCIEECPKYTIFIFCTTELHKVPKTILNRTQQYSFAPISTELIADRLRFICQQEGFQNYEQACDFISKRCSGCMRDAITTLEQCVDFSTDLSIENVKQVMTGLSYETLFKLTWSMQQKQESDIIATIEAIAGSGQDLKAFISVYMNFVLDLLKYQLFKAIELTDIPSYLATTENAVVQYTVSQSEKVWFTDLADVLLQLKSDLRYDLSSKTTIELTLLKFIRKAS